MVVYDGMAFPDPRIVCIEDPKVCPDCEGEVMEYGNYEFNQLGELVDFGELACKQCHMTVGYNFRPVREDEEV